MGQCQGFRFKDLTVDNAFDFCEVLAVIGVEQVIGAFDKDEIQQLQESGTDMKEVGIVIAMKVCGILIKNISKARNEICKFFANCMELDNGTAVTADDVKKFKLKQFVVMVKDFAKKDDLMDFFEGVAELVGTEQNDLMNAATVDMVTPTDIGSIQDAYQGFAKQNYTMLDNLKLGYGGTQSEMIRLINDSGILGEKIDSLDNVTFDQMIEAIHKVQDNLGITGTTALEAGTTISGSWSSVQALFENILTKVGSKLAPTVMGFLQQLSDWMETIDWDAFATSVGDALQRVFDWIQKIDFTTFFEKGMDGVENFLEKLGGLIEDVPKIIQTFKDWSPLIAGVAAGFVTLKVAMAISSLISAIATAWTAYKTANEGATIAQWLFNAALNANPIVLIVTLVAGLVVALITLWNTNDGFREAVTNAWEKIKEVFGTVIDAIKGFFSGLVEKVQTAWESVKEAVTNVFTAIADTVSAVWETIKNVITVGIMLIGSIIDAAFQIITLPWRFIWENCKEYIISAWNYIKDTVSSALNIISSVISDAWNIMAMLMKITKIAK